MSQLFNLPESSTISRRTLLKLFGVGTIVGLTGYSRFSKPQPSVFQQDNLDLPKILNTNKTVAVIGGGLAGLACAYQLVQRGFTVTLLEKSPQLGGKIASWEIEAAGETFRMEHGFHGFFPQYYNLNSVVSELGIKDNFQ
ncbi:MAG: FAD-dependent oxidoreductase, partial [Sphaerospermopsis kisseleviana]